MATIDKGRLPDVIGVDHCCDDAQTHPGRPTTRTLLDVICVDDCCDASAEELSRLARNSAKRKVLFAVLSINFAMFFVELGAGLVSGSVALISDSVDMLGDAIVYALSLYALDRGTRWHARAALTKAGIIGAFGLWILFEVARRALDGGVPTAETIGAVGLLALAANAACLALLWQFRTHDVNMSSTFECSRNDVAANWGVLAAAAGVLLTGEGWPDLVVGLLIAAVFIRSAFTIARAAWRQAFKSEGHRAQPALP